MEAILKIAFIVIAILYEVFVMRAAFESDVFTGIISMLLPVALGLICLKFINENEKLKKL